MVEIRNNSSSVSLDKECPVCEDCNRGRDSTWRGQRIPDFA